MVNKKPTLQEILDKISQEKKTPPNDIGIAEQQAAETLKEKTLLNKGLEEYFDLRKKWSWHIAGILWISTLFIIAMTALIGLQCLNFDSYLYLPHSIVAAFFAEIVGICYIVTKCLFPPNFLGKSG